MPSPTKFVTSPADALFEKSMRDLIHFKKWDDLIELCQEKVHADALVDYEERTSKQPQSFLHLLLSEKVILPSPVIEALCALDPKSISKRDLQGRSPLYLAAAFDSNYEVFQSLFLRSWPLEVTELSECLPTILPFELIQKYVYPFVADFVVFDQSSSGWTCLHMLVMIIGSGSSSSSAQKSIRLCLKCAPEMAGLSNKFGATPLHLAAHYLSPTVCNWNIYVRLVRSFPQALVMKDSEDRTPLNIFQTRNPELVSSQCPLLHKYKKLLT